MFRRRLAEPQLPPEYLVVGLGNPGPQYDRTRHNVGFDAIDLLAKEHKVKLETRRFQSVFGQWERVLLAKPLTYMNLSGAAIKQIVSHYKIDVEKVLVIADELDFEPGVIKMRPHGGAGGHNGHRSIIQSLGTDRYPRIRVGIGKGIGGVDHVLGRFSPDERQVIDECLQKAARGAEIFVQEGLDRAVTWVNTP